jgi:hypothetical protein
MPADDGLGLHENQMGAPAFTETLQEDPEDPVPRPEPWSLDASPKDRKLLAEGQVLQSQGGSATEEAAKNEGNGPHKGHPYLPLELSGLVEIRSREYAGQVPETQAWCSR